MEIFADRIEAGQFLAEKLEDYKDDPSVILIALPRGGVVLGYEVARLLNLPLDIVSPRKVGAPFNPELAIGAITETGEGIFSETLISELGITKEYLDKEIEKERKIALKRLELYRKNFPPRKLEGKRVILIDDGLATGSTMLAAIRTAKKEKAKEIIVAVAVAAQDSLKKITKEVDKVVCLSAPSLFYAVSQFYGNFDEVTDDKVIWILQKSLERTLQKTSKPE